MADVAVTAPPDVKDGSDSTLPDSGTGDVPRDVPAELPPPECTTEDARFSCNDQDPCTTEGCDAGACVNTPIHACCLSDGDCDDGVGCTVDECNLQKHQCLHIREDNNCCLQAADCNDGDDCTEDVCAANRCAYPRRASAACACGVGVLCDDNNPCTTDACGFDDACEYQPNDAEGCCAGPADCDDGDGATWDACQLGRCLHRQLACEDDAACAGANVCSSAACVAGACAFGAADCCLVDSECADGVDETEDSCVAGSCIHAVGATEPCTDAAECVAAVGPCVDAVCGAAGRCSYSALHDEGCCADADECPTSAPCNAPTCVDWTCGEVPATGLRAFWRSDWDDGSLGGWTVEAGGGAGAFWQPSQSQAISAPFSLYYGVAGAKDYDVGHTFGAATSPAVTVPPSATYSVRFWRNALVEAITSVDKVWLEVVQGDSVTEVWNKNADNGPGLVWKQEVVSLTDLFDPSAPIQLRINFDSIDGTNNTLEGVYVDDVELVLLCQ